MLIALVDEHLFDAIIARYTDPDPLEEEAWVTSKHVVVGDLAQLESLLD